MSFRPRWNLLSPHGASDYARKRCGTRQRLDTTRQPNGMVEADVCIFARRCKSHIFTRAGLEGHCGRKPTSSVMNCEKKTCRINDSMIEPLLLEMRKNDQSIDNLPEQDRVERIPACVKTKLW